ncbi:2-nitropropane dioxygenase [Cupriavidus sp. USMAA2-4]|uniref:Propionate 3-nitronate monooxygenase n=1 Tax=Cupriavidus malaysiensis TaxID=367825 RepID=A0ABM6F0C3_9BURK|nr:MULTISPECIES: nitronate monooxygenase [Cupriavidus]AOY92196.1 2-nitropropane dioxygenase [Cupriavidus sp. USMAA2-4]AOZ04662.1 2-nitropropane dioxygenase [Cupriavidus malaysiensis]
MSFLPSRLPIIQAPMVGSLSPLAIAVCEAGGLGSLACAALSPAQLREQIAAIRAATPAPFNVNFFSHTAPPPDDAAQARWREQLAPYYGEIGLELSAAGSGPGRAPFDEAMCAVVEETRPPVVSFHFGLPEAGLLQRVRATGAMILSSATTVEEARWLEARGVDAIIAQGNEAGGHRGMFLTGDIHAQPGLFALLPQIVDAVRVPVIAAGAIADGRGVAAAFALGASAAQIGTAYLLTPQAGRSALHRAAVRAGRDDTTRLTNLYTGRPARGLLTRFMREQGPMSEVAPAFPLATGAVDPLRAAFEKAGRDDFSVLWSGEAAALARETDAGDLTREIWEAARRCAGGVDAALARQLDTARAG